MNRSFLTSLLLLVGAVACSGASSSNPDAGPVDAGSVDAGLTTIAAARTAGLTTPITVRAVVTGLHGTPGDYSQWYIEDPAGGPNSGVAVYCDPDKAACPTIRAPALYSLVEISGSLSTYHSLLQFTPTAQTVVQAAVTPPAAIPVTMADVAEQATAGTYRGVYVKLTPTLTVDALTPAALLDTECSTTIAGGTDSPGEPQDGGLYSCSPACSPPAFSGFQANDGMGHELYIENFFFYTEHLQNSPECLTQSGVIPVTVGMTFSSMAGILDWDAYGSAQALYPTQDSDYATP